MIQTWELENFLNTIREFTEEHRSCSLLVRHSIREEITSPSDHTKALLTAEGKRYARQFGAALPSSMNIHFFHSPIERCRETVEAIRQGYPGTTENYGAREFLGCPFIHDVETFGQVAIGKGVKVAVRRWIRGDFADDVIMPWQTVAYALLQNILHTNHVTSPTGIDIFVTHDLNLIPLLNLLFDLSQEAFEWPYFLEGGIIRYKDPAIRITLRKKTKSLDLREISALHSKEKNH